MARNRRSRPEAPAAAPSRRAERRLIELAAKRAAGKREAEFRRAPGGDPALPIEIATSAIVELRAEALGCPRCLGRPRTVEHLAEIVDGVRLRVALVRCTSCGFERAVWFRIVPPA